MKKNHIFKRQATLFSLLFLLLCFCNVNSLLAQRPVITHNVLTDGPLTIDAPKFGNDYILTGVDTSRIGHPILAKKPAVYYSSWVEVTFSAPFQYTGGSIVIGILNNTGSYNTSSNATFRYSTVGANRTLAYQVDGTTPINTAALPNGGMSSNRANVRFNVCTTSAGTTCSTKIIGTDTLAGYNIPIHTFYNHSYVQHIFTATELGITNGQWINKIAFEYCYLTTTKNPVTIYIGNTVKNNFTAGNDWVPISSMTQVYNGSIVFPSQTIKYNEIPQKPATSGAANVVVIKSGYQGTITLDNLHIKTTPLRWRSNCGTPCIPPDGRSGMSCITVEGAYNGDNTNPVTKVNMILKGYNRLCYAADDYCAIQVNQGAQIHINSIDPWDHSSGILRAECTAFASSNSGGGAAIGGPNWLSNETLAQGTATITGTGCQKDITAGGNVIISSGTVDALGGHGAGIGGGWYAYYNGLIVITNGIVNAKAQFHAAGIGSGCPNGNGVELGCRAPNSAIIALPPCVINSCGVKDGGCLASLSLAGAEFISYVNDPAKPKVNIRTVDFEPRAPIYLDLTTVPGLEAVFDNIYPNFALNKVFIGRTCDDGIIPLHCWFQNPVTFFTTASSSKPATWGRPYLPRHTTTPGTQQTPNYQVILPLLEADVEFTDQWAFPICPPIDYTYQQTIDNAYQLRIDYHDPVPLNELVWILQDGAHSDFQGLTFQKEVGGVLGTPTTTGPTTLNAGDTWLVTIPINLGKQVGYYSDVLLIGGKWGNTPLGGYLRRIGKQRIVFCPSDPNFCVSTTKQGLTVPYPVNPGPATTVPLSLTINHNHAQNIFPYDPDDALAWYTISKSPTFAGAVAEKPVWQWTPLRIPETENEPEETNVSLAGLQIGVYYIHWFVESGTGMGFSGTVTTPNNATCGGFGPYFVTSIGNSGEISCANCPICPGTTASLLSVSAASGGTGSFDYRWEYSTTGSSGPWSIAPGANNLLTYTTGALSSVTWFRRVAIDKNTTTEYPGNVVTVDIRPATPDFSSYNKTYCINTTPAPELPPTSDNGISGTWTLNDNPVTTVNTATAGAFTYVFTPGAGYCNNTPVNVSITITNKTTPSFGFTTTYCFGATPDALPGNSTNGIGGTWSPNSITTTDTTKVYTYTFTPNSNHCANATNVNVTINGAAITDFHYHALSYCISGSSAVEEPEISGIASWKYGTFIATPSGLSIDPSTGFISLGTSTAGVYTVTYTSPAGTCPAVSRSTQVTLIAGSGGVSLNYSTLNPTNPMCTGTEGNTPNVPTTYSPTITGGPSRTQGTWTVTAPGVDGTQALSASCFEYLGANAGQITVSSSCTPAPNVYTIIFTPDPVLFPGTCDVTYIWTVNAAPEFTISYPTPFCNNDAALKTVTIDCAAGNCLGGTFGGPAALSLNPLTGAINPLLSTAGIYNSDPYRVFYTVPAAGGCHAVTAYANGTTGITVKEIPAQPAGAITGPLTVCKNGANVSYSVSGLTEDATWSVVSGAGWSLVSQSGTNNSNAIFTPGTENAVISVTQSNTCGTGTAKTVTINVVDAPVQPTISGPATPCVGSPVNYGVATQVPGETYSWIINGDGWTPTSGNGASISVTPGSGNATITVTANNGTCTTQNSISVTPLPTTIPQPSIIAFDPNNDFPCRGDLGLTYTVVDEGYSYQWTSIPPGWNVVSGEFTNQLTLNTTGVAHEGTITVTARTACASSTRSLQVMVNDIPQVSGLSGDEICAGELLFPVTLEIAETPINVAGVLYNWTISGSLVNTTNLVNTPNDYLTVIPGEYGGTVTVNATNRCGTGNTLTCNIEIIPFSDAFDIIVNDTTICIGASVDLYDLVSAPNVIDPEFHWFTTATGDTPVSNPESVSPSITTEYFVSVEGHDFCDGAPDENGRAMVTVTVKDKPIVVQKNKCK